MNVLKQIKYKHSNRFFNLNKLSYTSSTIQKKKSKRGNRFNDSDLSLPEFPSLIRNLFKKIHPDILRARSPLEADINDSSIKELNGVLSTLKIYNQFPPVMSKTIIFYVKSNDSNDLSQVSLTLNTSGGDCKRMLMTTFESFFKKTGVHTGSFRWGNEYFPSQPREL